jgi:cyclase
MTYLRPFMENMKKTTIISYGKELTLVIGGGGNSGIITSDSLVIVIDTKMDDATKMLHDIVIQRASNKPILVINTHFHPDHTKGNKLYKGATIIAGGNYTEDIWNEEAGKEGIPTKWLKNKMDIKMGNDTVTIFNLGKNIHTESDVVVYLHKRKILFSGDLILNKQAPALFGKADPDAYLPAFDELQKEFDIRKIVPGHGEVGGIEVLENFRQYFKDMKLAATDDSKKEEMLAKYDGWVQIPIFMSPAATVKAFKKKAGN